MTVSRALRNVGYISEATRSRVLSAVEKLGYRPNPLVSALMTQIHQGRLSDRDNVIAYLTDSAVRGGWRRNATYRQFFEGATARAFQRGYRLEEFWTGEYGFSAARLGRALYARSIHGLIIGPMESPHGHLNLKWSNFSAAAIGYSLLRPALDRVSNDQYDSALIALRELRRLGYRRIGLALEGRADARVHYRWSSAFLLHQWRYGPADPSLLYAPDIWRQEGFCNWVDESRIDALITLDFDTFQWLLDAGCRVPEDVAVAHLDLASQQPFRAGIDQRSDTVGSAAVDVVVERINTNEFGVPTHPRVVSLPGKWVPGRTVAAKGKRRVTNNRYIALSEKLAADKVR